MSFSKEKSSILLPQKEKALFTFFTALITASALFLPYMFLSKGYFVFFGDFNVQQIPFYKLCHKAVREGNIYWSFNTDLGANFIGSYAFYLLGSPFFWITLLFPNSFVPYLMGPLLILKFALCALTAYLYIRRFTKYAYSASLGGLLYAFSGFSVYNIFFNHFHEAIIVFPLLLLGLEMLMTENKKGVFAIAVALSAAVNYFFFFGMAVFTLIYFFVRVLSGAVKLTLTRFLNVVFEAVIGFLMSSLIVLPAIAAVLGNGRLSDFLLGWSAITYGKESIYLNIIQCFFFPPDLPARPVFFPEANVKWSSLAGWLPIFSMAGVFAFFKARKNSWLKRTVGICIFMALVPILNSSFSALNTAYYARWFFMPILLMCLMTVQMGEDADAPFGYGVGWTLGITLAFSLVIGLFPQKTDGKITLGLFTKPQDITYLSRFIYACVTALIGILVLCVLLKIRQNGIGRFLKSAIACVCIMAVIYGNVFIATGRSHSYDIKNVVIDRLIEGKVTLPKDDGYRIDVYGGVDNTAMYLGYPSINAFHSVVPASVMEFYDYIGVERSVASRPDTEYPALRTLLSVKYLLNDTTLDKFIDGDGEPKMAGFKYLKTDGGYYVYENQNYVGYGFSYDHYMSYAYADSFPQRNRSYLMLKAMLLDDSQIKKYSDIMTDITEAEFTGFTDEDLKQDAETLSKTQAQSFKIDNRGFTATVIRDKKSLVFFSVPYDEGFTATVDGVPAEIERVNKGFMAVLVDAGTSVIRFNYRTPMLDTGIYVSLISIIIFLIYFIICGIYLGRNNTETVYPEGEQLLEKWKREDIAEETKRIREERYEPSLLDKLEEPLIVTPPNENNGGFKINTDIFDK